MSDVDADALQLARIAWESADANQRDALVVLAYGYRDGGTVAAYPWEHIGDANRKALALGLSKMRALVGRALVAQAKQTGKVSDAGDGNSRAAAGSRDPAPAAATP